MNRTQLFAAAAFSLLAAAGAQAETYDGVHTGVSGRDRAEVQAEAVKAASAKDQNVTRGSRGADPFVSSADPAVVRAQAISAANAPDQNVTGGSRVNSRVISTMKNRFDPAVQAQSQAPAAK